MRYRGCVGAPRTLLTTTLATTALRAAVAALTLACSATGTSARQESAALKALQPGSAASPRVEGPTFAEDLADGLREAARTRRPLLVLVSEPTDDPGSDAADSLGEERVAEAIEEHFVPVRIAPERIPRGEPWPYEQPGSETPTLLFLDADARQLVSRLDGTWTGGDVAREATIALRAVGAQPPDWLLLLVVELEDAPTRTAVFSMPCFWTGEARLGSIDGVVDTRAGWYAGREVVEVTYRPDLVSEKQLVTEAREARCAASAWAPDPEGALPPLEGEVRAARRSDQLYALEHSRLRWLPITPLQARRINGALADRRPVDRWLSPRQLRIAARLRELGRDAEVRLDSLSRPTEADDLAEYARQVELALGI